MANFTKRAIKESFMKLLNERALSQITIKDIVEDCGINRNSFYYHYADLPALIEEIVKEDIDRIINDHASIESLEKCLEVALSFALKNRRGALHIYNSVNRDILEKYLMSVCGYAVERYIETAADGISISADNRALIIRYYKCELFGQIIEWMNGGMKDDIVEDFHRFCGISRGMTVELLKRGADKEDGSALR